MQSRKMSLSHDMESRIITLDDGYWRIHCDTQDVGLEEQKKLQEYLSEIQMPHEIDEFGIGIHGSVLWEEIDEKLRPFYRGVEEIYPF